jgi:hypothetical protein
MIDERRIIKDLEGSCLLLIEVLSHVCMGGTEEYHGKLQSGEPRFKPGSSLVRIHTVTATPAISVNLNLSFNSTSLRPIILLLIEKYLKFVFET